MNAYMRNFGRLHAEAIRSNVTIKAVFKLTMAGWGTAATALVGNCRPGRWSSELRKYRAYLEST